MLHEGERRTRMRLASEKSMTATYVFEVYELWYSCHRCLALFAHSCA